MESFCFKDECLVEDLSSSQLLEDKQPHPTSREEVCLESRVFYYYRKI